MSVEVQQTINRLPELERLLNDLGELEVTMGYNLPDASRTYANGTNVATVAAAHVFGVPGELPQRDFMRTGIMAGEREIVASSVKALGAAFDRLGGAEQALGEIAQTGAQTILDRLKTTQQWAEPIKDETAERKGNATPLFQDGLLRDTITGVVRKGSGIVRTERPRG